eukprot:TRINITY_DN5267_c0_g1_i9.p1 TRINITY_DN5267_c0_g1~~TRINITY_DN5267_c0_g1_i9.p1  ORF type:complete len:523 (+),score=9.97 TRINITY_DN5267_c0_g1_i9:785-2353(+)
MLIRVAAVLCGVSAAFGCSCIWDDSPPGQYAKKLLKSEKTLVVGTVVLADDGATSVRVDITLKGEVRAGDVLRLPCSADGQEYCSRACPAPGSRVLENFADSWCGIPSVDSSVFQPKRGWGRGHDVRRHLALSTGHAIGALEGRCPLPGPDGFSERHPCDCYPATACPTSFGCTAQSQTACLTDCAAHHTVEACRHHVVERDCAWVDGACRQRKCSEFTDRGGCELADCEWSSHGAYCALPECRRYNESACPLGRCQVTDSDCSSLHCTDMSDRDFCEDQFPRCTWGNAGCVLTDCSSLPQKSLCSRAEQCGWTDATSSCDEMSCRVISDGNACPLQRCAREGAYCFAKGCEQLYNIGRGHANICRNSDQNCEWWAEAQSCQPGCAQHGADDCGGRPYCLWDAAALRCAGTSVDPYDYDCSVHAAPEACATATPYCTWVGGQCQATSCRDFSHNRTSCLLRGPCMFSESEGCRDKKCRESERRKRRNANQFRVVASRPSRCAEGGRAASGMTGCVVSYHALH